MDEVDSLVQILWDYLLVGHSLRQADCIFVLCSHDIRVADYAIDLYQLGYAPVLLFSGGVVQQDEALGVFWDMTEADIFARRASARGIVPDQILIENRSANTGENFRFTQRLLAERGLDFQSFILVQKPYMERRVFATAQTHWRDKEAVVTSPPISCADYLRGQLPRDAVIQHIVGDFQRVKVYGENGYQAPQAIPADVWKAFERLVALGYDERLIKRTVSRRSD
ncbi:MAG: YdcF family protein [Chloroflexi bacterium]|nr:YdcF family protein [Chloroflexota bacterium]